MVMIIFKTIIFLGWVKGFGFGFKMFVSGTAFEFDLV
jgi:hypothetical protein